MINLLELDAERRPSSIRHATTPPPAPASLSLEEVATYLAELMDVIRLARLMAAELIPDGQRESGYIGAWIEVSGVQLERVVNLSNVSRLDGAAGIPGYVHVVDRPIVDEDSPNPERFFVANLPD